MLKTLWWYLRRPHMYRELGRRIRYKTVGASELAPAAARAGVEEWCADLAVDTGAALQALIGATASPPVRQLHSDVFAAAERAQRNCPVVMGGPGNLDLLYHLSCHLGATRIVETGVAYGWSSLALLLALADGGGLLVSTDMPYVRRGGDRYVGCVVPDELKTNWKLLRYPDREGLPRALKLLPELDLCHYDSDKSYEGRTWAYGLLWSALRPGGFLVSDDIGDNRAFRDFSEARAMAPTVVAGLSSQDTTKYAGVLRKR